MLPDTFVTGADDFLLVVATGAVLVDVTIASALVTWAPLELALVAEELTVELVFSKNT